jgi:predicted metal-dependent HD superfamily phosphohydrolase
MKRRCPENMTRLQVRRLVQTRPMEWPLTERDDLREALLAAYGDPSRGYHDTRHLAEVLARIAELATTTAFDRDAVVLAAWFHDAVYDGQPDAEERSAQWALGADVPTAPEVARLVRLTEHHRPADDDINGCVLSDADLAILAAPAERYAEYATAVREEYAHVPEPDFRAGRAAILRQLLALPRLFATQTGHDRWEARARRNVEREIAELTR